MVELRQLERPRGSWLQRRWWCGKFAPKWQLSFQLRRLVWCRKSVWLCSVLEFGVGSSAFRAYFTGSTGSTGSTGYQYTHSGGFDRGIGGVEGVCGDDATLDPAAPVTFCTTRSNDCGVTRLISLSSEAFNPWLVCGLVKYMG